MSSTEARIRDLADRAELADMVARHSLWIDERRYDEADRLFTRDAVVTTRAGEARGVEAIAGLARSRHAKYAATLHSKSNLVIEVDGATATVRAHDLAVFTIDDESEAVAAAIHRYSARRTEAGWRFDRLDITPVSQTTPLTRAA